MPLKTLFSNKIEKVFVHNFIFKSNITKNKKRAWQRLQRFLTENYLFLQIYVALNLNLKNEFFEFKIKVEVLI